MDREHLLLEVFLMIRPGMTSSNPRAAATRIQSAKPGRAGGQRKHDLRHAPIPKYVNQNRTHLNSVIVQPMTPRRLRAICQERRALRHTQRAMKSNASVAMTGLIVFGREVQADFEALSLEEQNAAYRDVAKAIADRLNTTVTGLVAHRDETAPHAHFQFPAYDRSGNAISSVVKRAVTAELQTITAEVMQGYVGRIERGYRKYDRLRAGAEFADTVHRSVAELHHDLGPEISAARANRDRLQEEAEKLAKRIAKLHEKEELAAKEAKRLQTYERRLAKKQDELATLEARANHIEAAANTALDAQKASQARRKRIEDESVQVHEGIIREAQEASEALLSRARKDAVEEAVQVTAKVSCRLEKKLLTEGQRALLIVERERDQWKAAFELLRGTIRKLVPTSLYDALRSRFMSHWSRHPDNPDRKLAAHQESSPKPPGP